MTSVGGQPGQPGSSELSPSPRVEGVPVKAPCGPLTAQREKVLFFRPENNRPGQGFALRSELEEGI